jgi:hypothetical protein
MALLLSPKIDAASITITPSLSLSSSSFLAFSPARLKKSTFSSGYFHKLLTTTTTKTTRRKKLAQHQQHQNKINLKNIDSETDYIGYNVVRYNDESLRSSLDEISTLNNNFSSSFYAYSNLNSRVFSSNFSGNGLEDVEGGIFGVGGSGMSNKEETRQYWALVLIIFPICTIFGNSLVVLSVYREKTLRTVTNYFVVSLAVADLGVAACVMPIAVYYELTKKWSLSNFLCDLWVATDVMASTASILNLVAIAIDR